MLSFLIPFGPFHSSEPKNSSYNFFLASNSMWFVSIQPNMKISTKRPQPLKHEVESRTVIAHCKSLETNKLKNANANHNHHSKPEPLPDDKFRDRKFSAP
jgi:hypothetical protein